MGNSKIDKLVEWVKDPVSTMKVVDYDNNSVTIEGLEPEKYGKFNGYETVNALDGLWKGDMDPSDWNVVDVAPNTVKYILKSSVIKSSKYQVEYYNNGETWLDTVSAESEEAAIKQVESENPGCEIKGAYKLEEYAFAEPEEERDTLDLTTDRFEPKASEWDWGEFTDSGRELQESLYNVLGDKGLYPDDITVKEKDGATKVYIDIGGDWKHEHGYLRYVMTDELGYMEINQETLPDDFYGEGSDSYRARHTFVMFPELMKFNEMRGIKNSRQIKSGKTIGELAEKYQDAIYDLEDFFGVNSEHGHFYLGRRLTDSDYMEGLDDICRRHNIRFEPLDTDEFSYHIVKNSRQINSMAVKQIEKYYQKGILTKREVIAILMKENGWEFPQAKQIADYYERVFGPITNSRNTNSLNAIFNN